MRSGIECGLVDWLSRVQQTRRVTRGIARGKEDQSGVESSAVQCSAVRCGAVLRRNWSWRIAKKSREGGKSEVQPSSTCSCGSCRVTCASTTNSHLAIASQGAISAGPLSLLEYWKLHVRVSVQLAALSTARQPMLCAPVFHPELHATYCTTQTHNYCLLYLQKEKSERTQGPSLDAYSVAEKQQDAQRARQFTLFCPLPKGPTTS